jgi:hypothetical protein
MKRFSLYCLFLVNVQITIGQQSYSTPNNFFDLRKQILSNIKNETVQFNEPEDEKDNAMAKFKRWEQFMLPRVGQKESCLILTQFIKHTIIIMPKTKHYLILIHGQPLAHFMILPVAHIMAHALE